MAEQVTLNLPDGLASRMREVAALTQQGLEEVLLEWLDRGSAELAIAALSDEQVLRLCDLQMSEGEQVQMGELLMRQREGLLESGERGLLEGLLQMYRRGMVRKAEALKVAVERGLRERLG